MTPWRQKPTATRPTVDGQRSDQNMAHGGSLQTPDLPPEDAKLHSWEAKLALSAIYFI